MNCRNVTLTTGFTNIIISIFDLQITISIKKGPTTKRDSFENFKVVWQLSKQCANSKQNKALKLEEDAQIQISAVNGQENGQRHTITVI